jgi:hypothetical protein
MRYVAILIEIDIPIKHIAQQILLPGGTRLAPRVASLDGGYPAAFRRRPAGWVR